MTFNDLVKSIRDDRIEKNFDGDIRDYVQPGDIYYTSGGYDMTIVTFYEVISLVGAQTAILRELGINIENDGHSGRATPILGTYKGDEFRSRATNSYYNDCPVAFNVDRYEKARKWDGQPKYYNSYD